MTEESRKDLLTQQLMAAQSRLYAFAVALTHDPDAAQDVLQNANLVMLRKLDEVAPEQNLLAWAQTVVRFEVMGYRRDAARDRLQFDDAFIEAVAAAAAQRSELYESRVRALHHCMGALEPKQRQMIEQRYAAGGSVRNLAESLDRPYGSVRQSLHRIRASLVDCVAQRLSREDAE